MAEAQTTTFEEYLERYWAELEARDYRKAEATVREMTARAPNPAGGKAISALLRSAIAAARKRDDEARSLLAEAEAATPEEPELLNLALYSYLHAQRLDFAGHAFDRLLDRAPDVAREFPPKLVFGLMRRSGESQAVLDRRRVVLAELGYLGERGDWLSLSAMRSLLDRGETARAANLLRYIDEPEILENLLIQRRYAGLWAAAAAKAGPAFADSRRSVVKAALDRAAAEPGWESFADLINAYRAVGRPDDALSLLDRLPKAPAELAKAEEHLGWAVNNMALAHYEAGQPAEGDALFARLNEALPSNDWGISMLINRIELLVEHGSYAEALPLIEEAVKEPKNDYAEQLLRRLRYCALAKTGRAADLPALRGELLAHAKDARAATVDGLLCADEVAEAEKLTLASLSDAEFEVDFVRAMQPKPLRGDDPSAWSWWQKLRNRPAVEAAYARLGRDLPVEFRASAAAAKP